VLAAFIIDMSGGNLHKKIIQYIQLVPFTDGQPLISFLSYRS